MEQKKPFELMPNYGVPPYYYRDDEVSLIDLWLILARRRWLIVGIFTLCIAAGAAFTALTKPLYESRAVINVGQINGVGQVEPPKDLVERLREQYRVGDKSEGPIEPPYVSDVAMPKDGSGDAVVIKARARSPEQARGYLETVLAKVIKGHEQRYLAIHSQLTARLDGLIKQRDAIVQQTGAIDRRVQALGANNATLAASLTLQKANLMGQIPDIEDQLGKLRLTLSSVQSNPTTVIRTPTLPARAVKPRPLLYMALSVVLGLVAGVFGAFAAEFFSKARAEMAARELERVA